MLSIAYLQGHQARASLELPQVFVDDDLALFAVEKAVAVENHVRMGRNYDPSQFPCPFEQFLRTGDPILAPVIPLNVGDSVDEHVTQVCVQLYSSQYHKGRRVSKSFKGGAGPKAFVFGNADGIYALFYGTLDNVPRFS